MQTQTNAIERILLTATELCRQRSVRLTPQRLEVLRLMARQNGAISAYDLLDLLRVTEPQAKPPTVYRALDFLLKQGFIHKVESTNGYIMCHHFDHPSHTSALFICDHCTQVTEHHIEGIEKILHNIANKIDFNLKHSVVETHGTCARCYRIKT